ncbi:hypothetical protein L208DRAFT_595377 [Tricholoma matsutake]|nr:hypothetical protein L208DRAFT_595377 [Tricholoma matsutake 945]
MRSSISSFFSSVFPVVHADSEEKHEEVKQDAAEEVDSEAAPVEEPEEPEDLHPIIREECKQSAKCAALTKHFEHCQEKVHAGQGFKGEDCVEEIPVHMMHSVDECAAPKLFTKLR